MSGIEKINLESEDLIAERIEQLKALFPEIATEGRLPSKSKESSTPPPIEQNRLREAAAHPGRRGGRGTGALCFHMAW